MRMYDLIEKKKRGGTLEKEEIRAMIRGFVAGEIPDYQMSAMLMAICFQGMSDEETTCLTLEMAHSGDVMDLSPIEGFKVDKHSTGGVGDKTTLIAGPIVASLGVRVAKMSGRGLGHTGGTIDKLEAIPGFQTALDTERFFEIVRRVGIAVAGQSGNLVPADKKLYALRDVTATVDSIPLIASSIMSKKLAAGSDGIVLDVKTGSGAFMKTLEDSVTLAGKMVAIGTGAGRVCTALITDMDVPLGYAIGNALEVEESIRVLDGGGPEDLREVSLRLAAEMLHTAGRGSERQCYELAAGALRDRSALRTFAEMIRAQGGDGRVAEEPDRLAKAPFCHEVKAEESGYVAHMDTEACGIASVLLKAGRSTKDDVIDPAAGIVLKKKYGDAVAKGETLACLYASDEALFAQAEQTLRRAYRLEPARPAARRWIYARVSREGTQRFE